jgi:hypothetical protein
MKAEVLSAIARVRRAMPRNVDVMLVCDELERQLVAPSTDGPRLKFDRVAYQREYMRERRARRKREAEKAK